MPTHEHAHFPVVAATSTLKLDAQLRFALDSAGLDEQDLPQAEADALVQKAHIACPCSSAVTPTSPDAWNRVAPGLLATSDRGSPWESA